MNSAAKTHHQFITWKYHITLFIQHILSLDSSLTSGVKQYRNHE